MDFDKKINNIHIELEVSHDGKWKALPLRTGVWRKGSTTIVHPVVTSLPYCFEALDLMQVLAMQVMPWLAKKAPGLPIRVTIELTAAVAGAGEKEQV